MANCEACPHHSGIEAEIRKLCTLLDERQKQSDLRFGTNREAITVAKEDMERRLAGMNEFRAQLSAQAATFVSRLELRLEVEKLIARILSLEEKVTYRAGSKHWSDYIITSGIALVIFLFAHYILKF